MERLLAAPGHDLRPHGHRQVRRARVLRRLLRADGAGPACRQADRRSARSASAIRGRTSTATRSCRRTSSTTIATFITKSAAFDPDEPDELPLAGHGGLRTSRTTGRASSSSGCSRSSCGTSRVEVNYVWRKYDQFTWTDRLNWTRANFRAVHADADQLRADGQSATPVTYYRADVAAAVAVRPHEPAGSVPRLQRRRVRADQALLGSLDGQRQLRLEQRDRSLGFAIAGIEDPTNLENLNGACVRAGVGRLRRRQRLQQRRVAVQGQRASTRRRSWDIGVAGSASVTQGYPFPQQIAITIARQRRGRHRVYLARSATCASPNLFVVDFRSTRRSRSAACASSRAWTSST